MAELIKRILVVDTMHEKLFSNLGASFIVDYKPGLAYEEVISIIENYQILVVRTGINVDKNLIEAGRQLVIIARAGAGMDNIDEDSAALHGIICINAPEGNRDSVAEQTLGMMLGLLHNIVKGDREVRNFMWQREENRGYELKNMTVGVVGYGNTGSEVVRRLSAFGCRILIYDKYKSLANIEGAEVCSMEEIFEDADMVTYHIPLTDITHQMIDSKYLNQFRKSIYLLNLSRGKIVKTRDLILALNDGKIRGLGLDVLENEKLKSLSTEQLEDFKNLTERDNVIFTPHTGGWSFESYEKISVVLAEKIKMLIGELKEKRNIFAKD